MKKIISSAVALSLTLTVANASMAQAQQEASTFIPNRPFIVEDFVNGIPNRPFVVEDFVNGIPNRPFIVEDFVNGIPNRPFIVEDFVNGIPNRPFTVEDLVDGTLLYDSNIGSLVLIEEVSNPELIFETKTITFPIGDNISIGRLSSTSGFNNIAIGTQSLASGTSIAIGRNTVADSMNSTAIGNSASALGMNSIAFGNSASVSNVNATSTSFSSIAIGNSANVSNISSIAIGDRTNITSHNSIAIGTQTSVTGDRSTAIGLFARATNNDTVAIGTNAVAAGRNCVAIGSESQCLEEATVSFGNPISGIRRRLTNISFGFNNNDAVAMGQIVPFALSLGGGARFNSTTGAFIAPTYSLSMGTFNNVGDALLALDRAIQSGGGPAGPAGPIGPAGPAGPIGPTGPIGPEGLSAYQLAVANGFVGNESDWLQSLVGPQGSPGVDGIHNPYFQANGQEDEKDRSQANAEGSVAVGPNAQANAENCVALGSGSTCDEANTVSVGNVSEERRITSVDDGRNDTDATNVRQVQNWDRWNLEQANKYTDMRFNVLSNRINDLDNRINKVGAMSTAQANMAQATLTNPGGASLAFGSGYYNGEIAFAVGYNRTFRTNEGKPISVTFSGAFSRGENMMGVGLAIPLR